MITKEYELRIKVKLHDSTGRRDEDAMQKFIEDAFTGYTYTTMHTTFNTRVIHIEELHTKDT
jgi:hypothetical protein